MESHLSSSSQRVRVPNEQVIWSNNLTEAENVERQEEASNSSSSQAIDPTYTPSRTIQMHVGGIILVSKDNSDETSIKGKEPQEDVDLDDSTIVVHNPSIVRTNVAHNSLHVNETALEHLQNVALLSLPSHTEAEEKDISEDSSQAMVPYQEPEQTTIIVQDAQRPQLKLSLESNMLARLQQLRANSKKRESSVDSLLAKAEENEALVRQGENALASLQTKVEKHKRQADLTQQSVSLTKREYSELKDRVHKSAESIFAYQRQLAESEQDVAQLNVKMTQNDARQLCQTLDQKLALLNTLKDKYLSFPNREGLTDEELAAIETLSHAAYQSIAGMQEKIEAPQLADKQVQRLKNALNAFRQYLEQVEDKIALLVPCLNQCTKTDIRLFYECFEEAFADLWRNERTLIDIAAERNEACLISVEEMAAINRLMVNSENAAEILRTAFLDDLLLESLLELWKATTSSEQFYQRILQKNRVLQGIISNDAKTKGQEVLTKINDMLDVIEAITEIAQHPLQVNEGLLATAQELEAIADFNQQLEARKVELNPALQNVILTHEESQAIREALKAAKQNFTAHDATITAVKARIVEDVRLHALAVVVKATNRLQNAENLKNTFIAIRERCNITNEALDNDLSFADTRLLIDARVNRIRDLTEQAVLTAAHSLLVLLTFETKDHLFTLEQKSNRLTALSMQQLADENRGLTQDRIVKCERLNALVEQHETHINNLQIPSRITPATNQEITALRAKFARNLQGLQGNVDLPISTDPLTRSNELNLDIKNNLAEAQRHIVTLEGIIVNHPEDARRVNENTRTEGQALCQKHLSLFNLCKECYDYLSLNFSDQSNQMPLNRQAFYDLSDGIGATYETLSRLIPERRQKMATLQSNINRLRQNLEAAKTSIGQIIVDQIDVINRHNETLESSVYTNNPTSNFTYGAIYNTISRTTMQHVGGAFSWLIPPVGGIVECLIVSGKKNEAKEKQDKFSKAVDLKGRIEIALREPTNN